MWGKKGGFRRLRGGDFGKRFYLGHKKAVSD